MNRSKVLPLGRRPIGASSLATESGGRRYLIVRSHLDPKRRGLVALCAGLLLPNAPARAADASIRIGTTAVILDDLISFLDRWKNYLEAALGRRVMFVQRGNYREIDELILSGQLDFAWICGYPYVRHREQMRLLAVPVYRGKPLYQSYLIVPASDSGTTSFADLKGKVFAYSDPNSNSGWLIPNYDMLRSGLDPQRLFRKSFFTWAHRKVVSAVAAGLAHGGAVDGYVWETLALTQPQLTARTRIAHKSAEYGFPPVVARRSISEGEFLIMQRTLLEMSGDPAGQKFLRELNLDGFIAGEPAIFDGIAKAMAFVDEHRGLA